MRIIKNKLHAHVLFTSLMTLSAALFALFLTKDKFISQERLAINYYQDYLLNKVSLIGLNKEEKDDVCKKNKKEKVILKMREDYYQFACKKNNLFSGGKPTKDKYIEFDRLEDVLDLTAEHIEVYHISSLSELPESSEQDPKIVVLKNEIDERLEKTFYGIIITDFYFDFTGRYNIYGVLYSSFDNRREERRLSFRKSVIDNLEEKYSYWRYLSYSRNLFNEAE